MESYNTCPPTNLLLLFKINVDFLNLYQHLVRFGTYKDSLTPVEITIDHNLQYYYV